MRFLIDNQLPPALARFIEAELGCEAKHVTDVGFSDASDADVWQYASTNTYVLVSKDEDFTHMVLQSSSACLIWVRVGNCRRVCLLDLFRRLWRTCSSDSSRVIASSRFADRITTEKSRSSLRRWQAAESPFLYD